MFSIPYIIGNTVILACMPDLATSINVMPFPIYALKLGHLKLSKIVIHLVDGSIAYHEGVIKDS